MPKVPRKLSLVRFDPQGLTAETKAKYPFKADAPLVFFGEIPNMPDHCVVADHKTGQIYSGYHTFNFVELGEDET